MGLRLLFALLLLTLVTPPALAEPAAWYRYKSLHKPGLHMCKQGDPGKGWVRVGGPYRNAACRK